MDESDRNQKPKRYFTLEEKLKIIKGHENGESNSQLATKNNVHRSSISRIITNKETIKRQYKEVLETGGNTGKRKRYSMSEDSRFETALYTWYKKKRSLGENITGPLLRKKALVFHKQIHGPSHFVASDGWLSRFKERHGIRLETKNEKLSTDSEYEKVSADAESTECIKNEPNMFEYILQINGYHTDNTFNTEKTESPDPAIRDNKKPYCKCFLHCKCTPLTAIKEIVVNDRKRNIQKEMNSFKMPKMKSILKKTIDDRRKITELKIAAFVAEHCSTETADHLIHIIRNSGNEFDLDPSTELDQSKCTALLFNVLSPCFKESLIQDVGDAYFSILIQENIIAGSRKVLCMMIRYFSESKKKIVTAFYKLLSIDTDNIDEYTAFKTLLEQDKLKLCNLIGIGIDSGSEIACSQDSFITQLKNDIPHLVVVNCLSNSLRLAVESACDVFPSELEFIVRETHSWFANSYIRQMNYSEIYDSISIHGPKDPSKLFDSEWLTCYEAIKVILDQWNSLKAHFEVVKERENCYTSELLHQLYSDNKNKIYLTFLAGILKKVIDVNMLFQSDQNNVFKLFEDLHNLFYSLLQHIVDPEYLEDVKVSQIANYRFQNNLKHINRVHFGYNFNQLSLSENEDDLMIIKETCKLFLISLCEQVQTKIPNDLRILERLSVFSLESAAKSNKINIDDICTEFSMICGDIESTIDEWNLVYKAKVSEKSSTELFWQEIYSITNSCGKPRFWNICKLVFSLLSLPFSNVTVEQIFSTIKAIEDELRDSSSVETVDAVLRVRESLGGNCAQFMPTEKMLIKCDFDQVYKCTFDNKILDYMNSQ